MNRYPALLNAVHEKRAAATTPQRRETMMQIILPHGCMLKNHAGDLVLTGPGLTDDLYREALANLPEATRERVIGWKRTAH